MYDGSALPLKKISKNTQEVVYYAHGHGVSVEGEIGSIGGAEEGVVVERLCKCTLLKPEDALHYVNETHVRCISSIYWYKHMASSNLKLRSIMNY